MTFDTVLAPPKRFDPASAERSFTFAANEACEPTRLHCLREKLKKQAPGIRLLWNALHPRRIFDELRSGEVQFVLTDGEPGGDRAADYLWKHLFDEKIVTLARPGHPLASRQISKRAFVDAKHIMITHEQDGANVLERSFQELDIEPDIAVRVSSVFAGLFLALDSQYLISVPVSVAMAIQKRVPYARIKQPL